jgi:ribosomal protein S18 acetylase RimI-like enzyme
MEDIELRKVTRDDISPLQQISRKTFFETYSAMNTEENMKKYLEENFSSAQLTAELSNPDSEFYFALLEDNVIGYIKLNFGPAQTDIRDDHSVEIERIYASKEFHGKKVGQALYEKALQVARDRKAEYIWLGVWEQNPRAIGFYRKNGFIEFDLHPFMLGNDEQTDILMKREL